MSARIMDRAALAAEVERIKSAGARVVFTNGCFDIIHVGHVRYLRSAAGLGDALIVGLNSDASVRRIKPGRPIILQDERAEVLANLDMVGYVCLFDEDTPYELIKAVRPDVLVKGGDWKPEDIVGSDLVPDTRSLPYEDGNSTTGIIERILALYCGSEEPQWVDALVSYDPVEIEIVADLLRSGGMMVRVLSAKVGPYPVNVGSMGEIKLQVPSEDLHSAREMIENFDMPEETE